MTRLSFQLGTEIERKATVLVWRLPKPQVTKLPNVPQDENLKKPASPFGRRIVPPVDAPKNAFSAR